MVRGFSLRNTLIQKLRLHILPLRKEAKKLRLSQVQAKILVNKLRLRLLPYDFRFSESEARLQIESPFPIRKWGLGDHKHMFECFFFPHIV